MTRTQTVSRVPKMTMFIIAVIILSTIAVYYLVMRPQTVPASANELPVKPTSAITVFAA